MPDAPGYRIARLDKSKFVPVTTFLANGRRRIEIEPGEGQPGLVMERQARNRDGQHYDAYGSTWQARIQMPPETPSTDPPAPAPCAEVTIPTSWTTVPGSATTHQFRKKTYEVQPHLAVDVQGTPMVPVIKGVKDPVSGAVTPVQDREELLAVTAHLLNRDASALSLRVGAKTDWAERAEYWDDQQQQFFDSSKGNVAAGLFITGKLLTAVAAEMATLGTANALAPSVVAASKTVTGGLVAVSVAGSTVDFIASAARQLSNNDKSLAPAIAALGDLDPEFRREVLYVPGMQAYMSRYFTTVANLNEVRDLLMFGAESVERLNQVRGNLRAARDPILAGTSLGQTALQNAYGFTAAALLNAGLAYGQDLLFRNLEDVTGAFYSILHTGNFYAMVLEAYALALDHTQTRLRTPDYFESAAAYNIALAKYLYRVGKYHEVRLGLITVMHEYATRLNNRSLWVLPTISSLSVPSEAVSAFGQEREQQRFRYELVLDAIQSQAQILGLVETRYPDFAQACSMD
jgi:hypothetical protein